MDMQEWQAYVKKVANSQYPVPEGMIKNYDDWRCRSIVGRMLYVLEDIEGAIAVLLTVKDIKPNLQDVPEKGLSEAEHMVLCLRDIAEIIYKVMGNVPIAITYLGHAHQICRAYKHPFRSADKGGVWHRSLELMEEIGETDKAIAKAEAMLEEEKDNFGKNPYRYYANIYLAKQAAKAEDYAKGAELIAEAYKYYPVNDACLKDLAEAAAVEDAKARYEKYAHCTTIQYNFWEERKVAVIDRSKQNLKHYFRKEVVLFCVYVPKMAHLICYPKYKKEYVQVVKV